MVADDVCTHVTVLAFVPSPTIKFASRNPAPVRNESEVDPRNFTVPSFMFKPRSPFAAVLETFVNIYPLVMRVAFALPFDVSCGLPGVPDRSNLPLTVRLTVALGSNCNTAPVWPPVVSMPVIVKFLHWAFAVIVTTTSLVEKLTSSEAPGAIPPNQVAPVFQLPVFTASKPVAILTVGETLIGDSTPPVALVLTVNVVRPVDDGVLRFEIMRVPVFALVTATLEIVITYGLPPEPSPLTATLAPENPVPEVTREAVFVHVHVEGMVTLASTIVLTPSPVNVSVSAIAVTLPKRVVGVIVAVPDPSPALNPRSTWLRGAILYG